eukprot:NODE_222_length_12365_cov_0.759009.p1 type:complete len:633 gc:universal NODE_222_length_12365_cov_0.759009:6404-4506(-)
MTRFISFLSFRFPNLISPNLFRHLQSDILEQVDAYDGPEDNREQFYFNFSDRNLGFKRKIKDWISVIGNGPPIEFRSITPDLFILWLSKLKKQGNGDQMLGKSAYNTHKAALGFLFKIHKITIDQEFYETMHNLFTGFKRTNALQAVSTNNRLIEGKDPLDIQALKILLNSWQIKGTSDSIFAHCFSLLCWNLMCRSANAVRLCFNHMHWQDDALQVFFCHSKTDQTGENIRYPRHVYCNPLAPSMCPILSLAVYLASFSIVPGQTQLFQGASQYNRFSNILLTEIDRLKPLNSEFAAVDIGSHSFRKGAKTYCSSGSTVGPSETAIKLRGGWLLGGTQDTYTDYQEAGDRYVGRFLCGLPSHNEHFATLPPEFSRNTPVELLRESIEMTFINLNPVHLHMAEFLLANLVYHYNYIVANFNPHHLVFQNPLFRDHIRIQMLQQHVNIHLFASDRLTATGVPPHAAIIYELKGIKQSVDEIVPAVATATQNTINGVVHEMEDRAVNFNTVTYEGLDTRINDVLVRVLNDAGLMNPIRDNSVVEDVVEPSALIYTHNGRLNLLPENYEIPNTNITNLIHLFFHGDSRIHIPPLKSVVPQDFSNKNHRKRLSDLKFIIKHIIGEYSEIPKPHKCY